MEKKDLKQVLANALLAEDGKPNDALLTILDWCNVHKTTFTGDPLTSAYGEGVRSVALRILAVLEYNDDAELYKASKNHTRKALFKR
jgi:hypothetical protein